MNNFVFSQDPLLYSSTLPQVPQSEVDIKKQLDSVMAQYQALQQKRGEEPPIQKQESKIDYLGELDSMIHDTDPDIIELLQVDEEYIQLNNMIQLAIQGAIMKEVKWKLNEDKDVIGYVNRLKEIIKSAQKEKESEERKNILEINEYIKNYSDMTFNEYKRLKQSVGK
jgi:hypothetical protein